VNYFEFRSLMNLRNATPTEKRLNDILEAVNSHTEFISELLKMVKFQREQIERLTDTVYKIAPELDVIETVAETPEEEAELIDRYMNRNPDWALESGWYKPKEIIEEMAQGDDEKRNELNRWYEDNGANYITQLYKKWKGIDHEQNLINNLKL